MFEIPGEGLDEQDPLYEKLQCSVQGKAYSYRCLMLDPDAEECGKRFPSHTELIVHCWNFHLDRPDPTQCPFKMGRKCLAKFSERTNLGLKQHMRLYHGSEFNFGASFTLSTTDTITALFWNLMYRYFLQ